MQSMGGVTKNRSPLHHHLNKTHQTNQNSREIQLVATLDKLGLTMAEKDFKRLYNMATGKIFPEQIYKLLLSVTATAEQLLPKFCRSGCQQIAKLCCSHPSPSFSRVIKRKKK